MSIEERVERVAMLAKLAGVPVDGEGMSRWYLLDERHVKIGLSLGDELRTHFDVLWDGAGQPTLIIPPFGLTILLYMPDLYVLLCLFDGLDFTKDDLTQMLDSLGFSRTSSAI